MPESRMVINYVPGEECRVAIVEDGKLEELHTERFAQASRVGNIYVGKVVNVEAAIQAAFVDFGVGDNAFLHVTDLHPRYFPGEEQDTTERVGFKTPRRERPPIQHALRRGDEVIVQVLKEGVGTKGPSVTSYLSIPGRFLVMMPHMDKVGVSRKVEDEDQRRQMREILDQLDLPDGFGFILRTAGFDRTKAELKRDLAYLQRLWKDMDRRLRAGGKPRLLYSESDLLVRSLRDMLTNDIGEVVIDSEVALHRAARFMKIVAPRGTTKLLQYPGKTPIFHAFGIEKQIALIHAREVPLPSGGRLVIDQTEALVAIDVNSGKSRESRDAETNAYQTNIEAVDEICRQLRLRDMGGIVINDLIDMRHASHRKDIENRFRERLKRDRAKSTTSSISEFGILEMTRQRMRPSHESVHFTDCPTCRGRGMLQKPDSVAADALRDLAAILDLERVFKVEMVVAPRVAGELLSTKRSLLGRIERTYEKHVDVRVSETVAVDRVTFYAYDEAGADVDVTTIPTPKKPREMVEWIDPNQTGDEWSEPDEKVPEPEPEPEPVVESHPIEFDEEDDGEPMPGPGGEPGGSGEPGEGGGRRRRRRRRRGRGGQGGGPAGQPAAPVEAGAAPPMDGAPTNPPPPGGQPFNEGQPGQPGEGGRRRRRRRRRGRGGGAGGPEGQPLPPPQRAEAPAAPSRPDASPETGGEWGDDPMPPMPRLDTELVIDPALTPPPLPPEALMEPRLDGAEGDDAEGDEVDEVAPGQPGPTEGPASMDPNAPPPGPGEGGRRRRRRRRRGRGGQGAADGGRPAPGQPPQGGQGQPRREAGGYSNPQRGGPRPQGQHGGPPRREAPPAPRPAPQVTPPPLPGASAGGKPRSLYGAARRKLSASELNKRPKPE